MQKGISEDRIKTDSLYFLKPIADNNTPDGRAENRRVEIYVLDAE